MASVVACGHSSDSGKASGADVDMAAHPLLVLVREKKLSKILSGADGAHWEASGVVLASGSLRIIFDDLEQMGTVALDLGSGSLGPGASSSSQYEAITGTGPYYVSREGTKGSVVVLDASGAFVKEQDTDLSFSDANKGVEGLALVDGKLLALSELGGALHVLTLSGDRWTTETTLALPVTFDDYADVALLPAGTGAYVMAVVSQASSSLWVGRLETGPFRVIGPGTVYDFPRDSDGKALYCEVEGITFLGPTTLAMVSDQSNDSDRCKEHDESVHVFELP